MQKHFSHLLQVAHLAPSLLSLKLQIKRLLNEFYTAFAQPIAPHSGFNISTFIYDTRAPTPTRSANRERERERERE